MKILTLKMGQSTQRTMTHKADIYRISFVIKLVSETDGDGGGFWLDTHMDAVPWVTRQKGGTWG